MSKMKKNHFGALKEATAYIGCVRTISTQALGGWEAGVKIDDDKMEKILAEAKLAWSNYKSADARKLVRGLIDIMEKKSDLNPDTAKILAEAYVLMAESYRYGLTNPEKAEAYYQKALRVSPDYPAAVTGLKEVKMDYDPFGILV